jgi:thiol:disulfide interchange protein
MKNLIVKVLFFFLVLCLSNNLVAQFGPIWQDKVTWDFSLEKKDDSHAFVVATARIKSGWHIYSSIHDPEKADYTGVPTKLTFSPSKKFRLIGKLTDTKKPKIIKDKSGTSLYFEGNISFKQEIEFLEDGPVDLVFTYSFMACSEESCTPPVDESTSLKAIGYKAAKVVASAVDSSKTNVATVQEAETKSSKDSVKSETKKGVSMKSVTTKKAKDSLWVIFLKGFGGGLIALLTPCVFPMIPMTVTFFTKRSKTRAKGIANALLYGVSIIFIYVALGLLVTAALGPSGLNDLSTNVWMNLIFFVIFIFFAISFLGAFELRLPSSWVNKADSNADKGGLIGIFFMAFTLSLVSFSCTGPIIGSLLVESAADGAILAPAMGMGGFAVALALPFALFAVFPGWLNSLPQSGGWLNSVKVVLGLLELALAMKFLSGVDLAYHWGILTRELFVAIWTVIFFVIGFYLLGKLKFSHDSNVEKLTVTRFLFALSAFVFGLYLLPGMWGAPLQLIDGVAPPRTHSEDNFSFVKGEGNASTSTKSEHYEAFKQYMHPVSDGSIMVFHELEKAKELAKLEGKNILLDFTGHQCANCRRTESKIWLDPAIKPWLQDRFIIVSLYVDDKTPLPLKEQKFSKVLQAKMTTIGMKWSDYEITHYNQITQPLYALIDADGNDISAPMGYEPSVVKYKAFLKAGLREPQTTLGEPQTPLR